ncbi:hypothetical protein AVEN_16585-1 [Araneus ventricosus]|uniref:Uncharacterized protein n=1 Tax=Araneus ventricosus TaxID=182803 RepID=A0A4Y2JQK1_ARAVE|nr:hypothetical protein AVEN_16585-1 [Araneus ventricosus]
MNELLGWYGYDKLDTRGLNLKHLNQHFPTSSSSSSPLRHDEDFSEDDMGLSRSPQPDSGPHTADLQWNRVSNLESSDPDAEILPLGYRGLERSFEVEESQT